MVRGRAGEGVVPGHAPAVGRLIRVLHDLTAGTALAGDREVVCHNDLSPKNTIYRGEGSDARPVAFFDWDLAAPGERIADVAHACWQYPGLGQVALTRRRGGSSGR